MKTKRTPQPPPPSSATITPRDLCTPENLQRLVEEVAELRADNAGLRKHIGDLVLQVESSLRHERNAALNIVEVVVELGGTVQDVAKRIRERGPTSSQCSICRRHHGLELIHERE